MAEFTFGPVGAIHRGNMRRAASRFGVSLTESKGLVDSTFHVTGSLVGLRGFHTFIADYVARNDALDVADDVREAAFNAQWRWWNPRTWSGPAKALWMWISIWLGSVVGLPFALLAILKLCGVPVQG